jgi:hypothetical protein
VSEVGIRFQVLGLRLIRPASPTLLLLSREPGKVGQPETQQQSRGWGRIDDAIDRVATILWRAADVNRPVRPCRAPAALVVPGCD